MAESTEVRVVRCPKCENLLPELADFSFYQCGGCGAVLTAGNKDRDGDNLSEKYTLSEKLDEGEASEIPAQEKESQEKGMVDFSDTSDADVKSNVDSSRSAEKKPEKDDNAVVDGARDQSKAKNGKLVVGDAIKVSIDGRDLGNAVGKECGDLIAQNGYMSESWKSGRVSSLQRQENGEMEGFRRIMRTEVQGVRFSTSNYQDEGPSNYNLNPAYDYGKVLQNYDEHDGSSRGQYLENDPAELLRKIDELKEQLSRSAKVTDKPREKPPFDGRPAPPNPRHDSDPRFPGGSSASNGAAMQFFVADNHASGIPYFNQHPEPFPYIHGHQVASRGFHPPMQKSSHITGYEDPFGPQMPRRDPHQVPGQYQQPVRQYFSGHYFDTSPDPFEPYPTNANFHHPTCSCFHCYNKHHGVPAPVPPTNFSNKRFPGISSSPIMYHQDIPRAFGSNHNSRTSITPTLNNRGPQSHIRWPSDNNSEMGGFVQFHPRKVVLPSGGRHCHPIAGGAPFLTCCNCFELLSIPKKVLLLAKKQQKFQCGTCSTIINFSFVNKKLILSINTEAGQASTMADDGSSLMTIDKISYSHGNTRRTNATFSSDDYDNSGYDFQAIDPDPIEPSTGQGLNSTKPQEMQSLTSSSPILSEDDNSPDALTAPREGTNSIEQPVKATLSPPLPGSPLQQYFDYSNYNRAVSRFGKGSHSSRSDQEKAITNKATARQNSMKEASLATETEVSFHEYSSTGVSQESGVASKEENPSKNSKGGESFFANFIKKSFKDISKSNQTDERTRNNVSVNGHVIPDRVVKKAEKLAGPIQPGQYWYDFQAGFWGVTGGPCLGMIPPFIEEFNHPMPENCSGGNTGVFVNGRELHQKDLDLLASRGLPTETDRSYIIKMSGRVVDEDTDEELESLGKLAPTVQKVKHGFGMKVPKVAA